jgi:hypothetical protein
MTTPDPFQTRITSPLHQFVGQRLQSVTYWIQSFMWESFDVEDPNAVTGCEIICLEFETGHLELTWDTDPDFLPCPEETSNESVRYHLRAGAHTSCNVIEQQGLNAWYEYLLNQDASTTSLWRAHIGKPLAATEIWGVALTDQRVSPQVAVLSFHEGEAAFSVGLSFLGSFDLGSEIQVLGGDDWRQTRESMARYLLRDPQGDQSP